MFLALKFQTFPHGSTHPDPLVEGGGGWGEVVYYYYALSRPHQSLHAIASSYTPCTVAEALK